MKKNFSRNIDAYEITDEELEKINTFAVKPLTRDDIFTFSVVLCDNEIDRDIERFDTEALEKLSQLFVGKPGIFDHSMKSSDQTARIFEISLVEDEFKRTTYGEKYTYLKAKAYMPLTKKNEDLIKEINAGIKKEVSINCSVSKKICSICNKDARSSSCRHEKGKDYNKKVCHHILCEPTDAYEWSFVAVPAQRNAGVTKHFKERTVDFLENESIFSVLKSVDDTLTLSREQSKNLLCEIEKLERKAHDGEEYRNFLKGEIMRLGVRAMPSVSSKSMGNICNLLSIEDLKRLKSDLEKSAEKSEGKPQLAASDTEKSEENNDFII